MTEKGSFSLCSSGCLIEALNGLKCTDFCLSCACEGALKALTCSQSQAFCPFYISKEREREKEKYSTLWATL